MRCEKGIRAHHLGALLLLLRLLVVSHGDFLLCTHRRHERIRVRVRRLSEGNRRVASGKWRRRRGGRGEGLSRSRPQSSVSLSTYFRRDPTAVLLLRSSFLVLRSFSTGFSNMIEVFLWNFCNPIAEFGIQESSTV